MIYPPYKDMNNCRPKHTPFVILFLTVNYFVDFYLFKCLNLFDIN
jgi:hypothetical protein